MSEPAATVESQPDVAQVARWIELLATEVGPRRPTSRAERLGAELMRSELSRHGLDGTLEPFDGYSTFGLPYGITAALAVLPSLLPARWHAVRSAIALTAFAALTSEAGLVHTPLSRLVSRRPSQNLVATIDAVGEPERTLCLVSHMDSSRSGLMFHPAFVRHLDTWIAAQAGAATVCATEPVLGRASAGRHLLGAARTVVASSLALLAERELRGEDVPGANDNASGVAVTAQLACECLERPLSSTRVVLLITGCEESGLLGAQAFLREHDTDGWLFVNFDSVGGAAPLRYIARDGAIRKWDADPALLAIAERIAGDRPDLNLKRAEAPIGLTYDTTPVAARAGRSLTFVAAEDVIPNYHWPSDTAENIDNDALRRALETGRAMLGAIDRGEADAPQTASADKLSV
jgi:hypothetical protein